MSGAILNLVRLNTADETAPLHDYTSGEIFERHEEIKLVNPSGDPCAIPLPAGLENIDYRFNLITGARNHQARAIRRRLTINVDYLDNEICRRLEHWMQQRARVLFAPNFGRYTAFSYRPVDMMEGSFGQFLNLKGTATDLTGNEDIGYHGPEFPLVWDFVKGRFVRTGYHYIDPINFSDVPMIHTQGGAAIGTPKSCRNLMVPAYPEGVTADPGAGNSGWQKAGTDAAQLTFTHNSGAFGHPACPDTLTVAYTNAVSSSRVIVASTLWDPLDGDYEGVTMTGSGLVNVCVWLRGQMPDNCQMVFSGATGSTTRDLASEHFDGWTPVFLSRYEADWSLSTPSLLFNLLSDDGVAGSFDIGPTMVAHSAGGRHPGGAYWAPSQTLTDRGELTTDNNFNFPEQGMAAVAFVVPELHGETYNEQPYYGLLGNTNWGLYAGANSLGVDYVNVNGGGGSTTFLVTGKGVTLRPGKINTVVYTWGSARQAVFLNGVLLGTVDRTAQNISFGTPTSLRVGYDKVDAGIYPGVLLSARVDEGSITDVEAMNLHWALTDPVALQAAAIARGRVFQIIGIPQTLRSSAGGSHVLGSIQLEQVDLQNWLADPLNAEGSTP